MLYCPHPAWLCSCTACVHHIQFLHHGVYYGFGKDTRRIPAKYGLRDMWEGHVLTEVGGTRGKQYEQYNWAVQLAVDLAVQSAVRTVSERPHRPWVAVSAGEPPSVVDVEGAT